MVKSTDYETVAAGVSDQTLGPVGKVGDILERLIITVNTALTAAVSIRDGDPAGPPLIPILPNSPGGGVGVYVVEIGALAKNATNPGWKVTTGAGSTVLAVGRFS